MVEFQASALGGLVGQERCLQTEKLPLLSAYPQSCLWHTDTGSQCHPSETHSSFRPVLTSLVHRVMSSDMGCQQEPWLPLSGEWQPRDGGQDGVLAPLLA